MLLLGYSGGRLPTNANREMARVEQTSRDHGPRWVAYSCRYYDTMITGSRTFPDINVALNTHNVPRGHSIEWADESGMFAGQRSGDVRYATVNVRRARHNRAGFADLAPTVAHGWLSRAVFDERLRRHERVRMMNARADLLDGMFVPGDGYAQSVHANDDTGRVYVDPRGQAHHRVLVPGATGMEWRAYGRTRTFPSRMAWVVWESADGFRADGFDHDGWDRQDYGREGFHRHTGFDREGFNRNGWDSIGHNRAGECGPRCTCSNISGYHQTPRDWRIPHNWSRRFLFGVELELHTGADCDQRHVCKSAPKRGKAPMYLITERDGSLGTYGVETVGPPLPVEAFVGPGKIKGHENPWPVFMDRVAGVVSVPTDGYGMHVNISRRPLASREGWEQRFLDSVNDCKRLVQFVAGRNENNWAGFRSPGRDRYNASVDKYRVANVKDEVIEIRLFKAHTSHSRMRANVQFCDALLRYTKRAACGLGIADDMTFIEWVRARPRKYGDLIALLADYVGWASSGRKEKPWSAPNMDDPDDYNDDSEDYDNDNDNDNDDYDNDNDDNDEE